MVAVSIAEDMEPGGERARPTELEVGDYVSWNSSGGRARGEIVQIERDGTINVPDSSFTITGTPDDPAALIQVYERIEGGWDDTDVYVGHKFSTLTKIDPLPEPMDVNGCLSSWLNINLNSSNSTFCRSCSWAEMEVTSTS